MRFAAICRALSAFVAPWLLAAFIAPMRPAAVCRAVCAFVAPWLLTALDTCSPHAQHNGPSFPLAFCHTLAPGNACRCRACRRHGHDSVLLSLRRTCRKPALHIDLCHRHVLCSGLSRPVRPCCTPAPGNDLSVPIPTDDALLFLPFSFLVANTFLTNH